MGANLGHMDLLFGAFNAKTRVSDLIPIATCLDTDGRSPLASQMRSLNGMKLDQRKQKIEIACRRFDNLLNLNKLDAVRLDVSFQPLDILDSLSRI